MFKSMNLLVIPHLKLDILTEKKYFLSFHHYLGIVLLTLLLAALKIMTFYPAKVGTLAIIFQNVIWPRWYMWFHIM